MKRLYIIFFILLCHESFAQSTVEGVVQNSQGEPLELVSIYIQGTSLGTYTDQRGRYELKNIPEGTHTIVASLLGHVQQEQEIYLSENQRAKINFQLSEEGFQFDELVLIGSRINETADRSAAPVVVISEQDIEREQVLSHQMNDLMTYQVPGYGISNRSASNSGQTLRGRPTLIMIDGIPQSTPLRDGARDLRSIDPGVVERIEVLKGASALYGNGAVGGMVNIVTKTPKTNEPFKSTTSLNASSSLTGADESLGYRVMQQFFGKKDKWDYMISGSYERIGLFKDAEGDIIPTNPNNQGGIANSDVYNFFGKAGYSPGEGKRWQLMYNFFRSVQDQEYILVPGEVGRTKATVRKAEEGEILDASQGTPANHNLGLSYSDVEIFSNTSFNASAYYQDFETVFGFFPDYYKGGGQSYIVSQKMGARTTFDTEVAALNSSLLYGLDALYDNTSQPLLDGRLFVPEIELFSAAPFLQIKNESIKNLILKGGIRMENINWNVGDFTTVEIGSPGNYSGGNFVEGGRVNYTSFLLNAGFVYDKFSFFQPFGSFSQGFSVGDAGQALRVYREPKVQAENIEPVVVNNYELGFRANSLRVSGEISGFVSTSELGSSITANEEGVLYVARAPEIIHGIEAAVDVFWSGKFSTAATFTYQEGKVDFNDDGDYADYLNGFRIAAPYTTLSATYRPQTNLSLTLRGLHSFERDRFSTDGVGSTTFGQGKVESFTTFDLITGYEVGKHQINVGIQNIFNEDYFSPLSYVYNFPSTYSKAPGTQISLTYKLKL
jgi:iron complex outermembrane recepter protein